MKFLTMILMIFGLMTHAYGQDHSHSMPHEMQHGFVLSVNDTHGSHLVASGHHSRQVEIKGKLIIENSLDNVAYEMRKVDSNGRSYFLFQAQHLDLPTLANGTMLEGHIVEAQLGKYEPKNIIVKKALFKVEKVLLNIPNPFFAD